MTYYLEKTYSPNVLKCRNEECYENTFRQNTTSGFASLCDHLPTCIGSNYKVLFCKAQEKHSAEQTRDQFACVNRHDCDLQVLIGRIVTRNQPVTELDHQVTRCVIRSDEICFKTWRKYILNLVPIVEENIAAILPRNALIPMGGLSLVFTM